MVYQERSGIPGRHVIFLTRHKLAPFFSLFRHFSQFWAERKKGGEIHGPPASNGTCTLSVDKVHHMVTRLGEFFIIGWLFTLGIFWKLPNYPKYLDYFFPREKLCKKFETNWLGYILSDFSETHLVNLAYNRDWIWFLIGTYIPRLVYRLKRLVLYTIVISLNNFVANAFLCLLFNTQTMHMHVDCTRQNCYDFPKNLTPWWDSSSGLLFLSRCQLRHAARVILKKYNYLYLYYAKMHT
jgi:hypothetical protein